MKIQGAFFVLTALSLLGGCSHTLGDAEHIPLDKTPPVVMEGFHREFPGLTLSHTDEITYLDGTVKYELKFRDAKNGYRRKLFSAQGELLDPKWEVAQVVQTQPAK